MTAEYRVHLDTFEGPLDLLLYLIRKAEVEITEIPLTTIADQYLEHLGQIDKVDIDLAGEFLVMAATLMELKSRMIAADAEPGDENPQSGKRDEAGPDPRTELVKQLLEYKKYRDAADALVKHKDEWEAMFPAAAAGVSADELKEAFESMDDPELEDLDLLDLFAAFRRIADSVNMDSLGEHEVVSDDTPIEIHAEDILERVRSGSGKGGQLTLFGVLHGRTRGEMVGLFLAMLSLIREQRLSFHQEQGAEGVKGQIMLEARDRPDHEDERDVPVSRMGDDYSG